MDWAAEVLHVAVEVVRKAKDQVGFVVQAHRWVVDRTFAWLVQCRRLVREYEELAEATEAWIYLAMTRRYLRRLARFAYESNAFSVAPFAVSNIAWNARTVFLLPIVLERQWIWMRRRSLSPE